MKADLGTWSRITVDLEIRSLIPLFYYIIKLTAEGS
jgi:hypothetical protein